MERVQVRDFIALKDLMDLLDENDTAMGCREGSPEDSTGGLPSGTVPDRQPGFRKKSTQFPPLKTNPDIWTFLSQVTSDIKNHILVLFMITKSLLSNSRQSINHKIIGISP